MDYAPRNELFTLGKNTDLNLSLRKLGKIIKSIERTSRAKIRCSTRGGTRTFMVHGFPKSVEMAKELLAEKTSKPTSLTFEIPARVRYDVVGDRGSTVKELGKTHDVSIWVDKEKFDLMPHHEKKPESPKPDCPYPTFLDDNNEPVFDRYPKMVSVKIKGRAENCGRAKAAILETVESSIETLGVMVAIPPEIHAFRRDIESSFLRLHRDADLEFDNRSDDKLVLSASKYRLEGVYSDLKTILAEFQRKICVCVLPVPYWMTEHMPFDCSCHWYKFSCDEKIFARYYPRSGTLNILSDKEENMLSAKQRVEEKLAEYRSVTIDLKDIGEFRYLKGVLDSCTVQDDLDDIEEDLDVKFLLPWYRSDEIDDQILEVVGKSEISLEHAINKFKEVLIPRDQVLVIDDIDVMLQPEAETILMKVIGDDLEFVSFDDCFYTLCVSPSDRGQLTAVNNSLNELRTRQQTSYKGLVLHFPSSDQRYLTTQSGILRSVYDGVAEDLSNSRYPYPRIELHSNEKKASNDELYIFGKSHEVERVGSNIQQLLKDLESFKKVGVFTKTVKVPSYYLSALIESKRKGFMEIKEKYNVGIQIHDEGDLVRRSTNFADESSETSLTLAGLKHSVLATEQYLVEKLDKLRNEKMESFSVTDHSTYLIVNDFNDTKPFKIKVMERLLDVKVWFHCRGRSYPRPASPDEVNISGRPEAIAEAKTKLKDMYKIRRS
ncbi:hypothetical protein CXQ85_001541 [Candidozyma haemuli]|uniref:K Homology domain-containing protein n=1 Tax=Candidozyma haemuli TaxID=45357 RepID=A0A2V1AME2_9ASCO|nr:hypothetical protein CXQ85_001541 [[Candida] haemuloni]PVH19240.1 hypothetical protein CXQ85_001541 [[Candida] haemuloni]